MITIVVIHATTLQISHEITVHEAFQRSSFFFVFDHSRERSLLDLKINISSLRTFAKIAESTRIQPSGQRAVNLL